MVRCCLLARHGHGIPKLATVGQQQHSTGRKKNVAGKVAVFGVPGGVGERGGHNQDTTHIKLSKAFNKDIVWDWTHNSSWPTCTRSGQSQFQHGLRSSESHPATEELLTAPGH